MRGVPDSHEENTMIPIASADPSDILASILKFGRREPPSLKNQDWRPDPERLGKAMLKRLRKNAKRIKSVADQNRQP